MINIKNDSLLLNIKGKPFNSFQWKFHLYKYDNVNKKNNVDLQNIQLPVEALDFGSLQAVGRQLHNMSGYDQSTACQTKYEEKKNLVR